MYAAVTMNMIPPYLRFLEAKARKFFNVIMCFAVKIENVIVKLIWFNIFNMFNMFNIENYKLKNL